ncbi:ComEA family DNA-binding protein [Cellulomonas sp. Y8]|uniref:ComEA family DNA-binding protein n=1 Tax=Cellulomonas sp. Y8 TaxID=2591145 RepID=UPI001FEFAFAD|nr:ComEA family DNA-binding protein [Cellulomonas sp. Y8]
MTWYDGGPAPDPRHDGPPRGARDDRPAPVVAAQAPPEDVTAAPGPVAAGRARLRDAARSAAPGVPVDHAGPGPMEDEAEPAPGERLRLAGLVRWRLAPRTAAVALGALLLVGGAVALRSAAQPTADPVAVEEPAVTAPATAAADETAPAEEATGWLHVVGQVASPGVVALPAGSRVADAVAAAGGALPDADLAGLNLAAVVQDGAQIRVPAPGEEPAADVGGAGGVAGAPGADGSGGVVDVNTAGSAELQGLPGIGPVLADRIVAWREANGPFGSVDALLDVSGIGPAVLGQIRELVRV